MVLTSLIFCNRVENNAMIGESINLQRKEDGMLAQNLFYHVKTIVHKLRPEKTYYDDPNGYAMCIQKGLIQRFEIKDIISFFNIFS